MGTPQCYLAQNPMQRCPPLPHTTSPPCWIPFAASQWHPNRRDTPTLLCSHHRHQPHHYLQHAVGLLQHSPLVRGEVDHAVGAGKETRVHLHPLTHSAPPAAAHPLPAACPMASCRIWRCRFDHEIGSLYIPRLSPRYSWDFPFPNTRS